MLVGLFIGGCASTQGAGLGTRELGPKIVKVEFHGNETLSAKHLGSLLATRESDRFLFFGSDEFLEPGAVDTDLRRIEDLYEEAGFYAATASAKIRSLDDGTVRVDFFIDEGPPTIVRSILIEGLDSVPARVRARTLDLAPLHRGERLIQEDYEALEQQIQSRLLAQGYATATVRGRAEVDPEAGTADVIFEVSPGEVYNFDGISVEGNRLIPSERIEEAAKLAIQPGARYSPRRLAEAQAEVFSLGVFSSSVAIGETPDPETRTVPVKLTVGEANFLRLRAGVGAGIEQGLEQVRATLDFAHLNLFGGMQRLTVHNDIAYRIVLGESRSGIAGRSVAELTQPDLFGPRIDGAVRAGYERQFTQSYTSESVSARVGTPIRFRRWLYLTPSYNIERFFHVSVFDSDSLAVQESRRSTPLVDCPDGCTFSYLEQRLIVDRRSNPMEPIYGWYASLGLQEGGGPLGGDFTWLRLSPEVRHYLPIARRMVLATRLEVGILQPLRQAEGCEDSPEAYSQAVRCSPIVVRFFGGGAGGFRGVGAGRLSPMRAVESSRSSRGVIFIPQGGNSSFLATAELRWFFAQSWSSAFFIDAGNVAAGAVEAFDLGEMHYAAGAGIRYRTPIGPARLDVGYRFLRRHLEVINSDQPVETRFIDWFGVFLSIGEAF